MKFSQNDIERILKEDAQIPESVDRRIHETYEKLGLTANGLHRVKKRRRRAWASVAAAAAIVAGLSITAVAATHF